MKLRFAHAVVYVSDMEAMLDFYTNILGFEVTDRGPIRGDDSPEIVFLSQDPVHHHQLAFLEGRQEVVPSNSVNHLAFRVEHLDDVKTLISTLEEDGRATQMRPLTHGNAWSIYFSDPEQNGVEIFCDSPFHVAQPQGLSWDTSLDETALTEWTRENYQGKTRFGPIDEYYEKRAVELAD